MKEVVTEAVAKMYIMVSGVPITQEFCDKIYADCYTYTSDAAIAYLISKHKF